MRDKIIKEIIDVEPHNESNQKHGKWIWHYKDSGAVALEAEFDQDKQVHKCVVYWPDGSIKLQGYLNDKGLRTGSWYRQDENGNIVFNKIFSNGIEIADGSNV